GWYFSADQAFDMAVAYQLNAKADYLSAMLANMNYEGGCNPVNVSYINGLGWKRSRETVTQWGLNDRRTLPPSGIPQGNIQAAFFYLWNYQTALEGLCFPPNGAGNAPYPYYDRWADAWNVSTEFVVLNQARGLGTLAFLAAQSPAKAQRWKALPAKIKLPAAKVAVGKPVTLTLQVPANLDLRGARVTWEGNDQEPAYGLSYTVTPSKSGAQWVEAEAQWPDGRRVFAQASFTAQ
ncbi:MAG TPA: hypothetical protein VNT26_05730, partial [Candidatus Sulfotelmatobacter sp.]|nr:hypothetical protein [Candidatus Sulfotelmatobacter sp.]